ncbi:hypothetical protein NIM72_18720 [Pantoea sp. B550]|uniref:hypothetical protein n=1 Tax=Pantoea TaxID=53335 RepID=UPI0020A0598F|nr:hypothetical protein [Pantoea sp. B550]MCP1207537.1 hypothetical protein [Pantoea sp. B550]
MKKYAIVRAGVEYGYIEDNHVFIKRWNEDYELKGGRFKTPHFAKEGRSPQNYVVDLPNKTMTRVEDGTVFDLIEIEQI